MPRSTSLVFTLLASLSLATTACSAFSSDDSSAGTDPELPARDEPKAPPVGGPADDAEINEQLGVFVSPRGRAGDAGTRRDPLASIQAGIELGKKLGKRVYVCSGSFKEAIVVQDSISIIGGLDCTTNQWHTSKEHTHVESPTSPALRAANIVSPTRIEGLEIIAPPGAAPSASSIALIAENANQLVIARSRITATSGANGIDGVAGIQLANSTTATGGALTIAQECHSGTCLQKFGGWARSPGALGGTNLCTGAPGHAAEAGGAGGSGGLWVPVSNIAGTRWGYYAGDASNTDDDGNKSPTSAAGADGVDGANAVAIGTFTAAGYTAPNGTDGTHGAPGKGGAGGSGDNPGSTLSATAAGPGSVWRGVGGAGGGAGGCAGLAGTAGTGGGASIAALLLQSAVTFEDTQLTSGAGGNGGRGAFGSTATDGGHAGVNVAPSQLAFGTGKDGGRGGAAGISGNGANGPSIGVVEIGSRPLVKSDCTISVASGGAAIEARSRAYLVGGTKVIPATPAGISKDILAL